MWEGSGAKAQGDHSSEGSCLWLCLLSCTPAPVLPGTAHYPAQGWGGKGFPGLLVPGLRPPLLVLNPVPPLPIVSSLCVFQSNPLYWASSFLGDPN